MSYYSNPINPTDSIRQGNSPKTKIKFLILLILWAVAFYPIYPELVQTWLKNSNNSHGILVPLISLFFIWQKREKIKSTPVSSYKLGLFIFFLSMLLYIISYAGDLALVSRLMIIFSIIGLILFTHGKSIYKLVAFPLLFLIFMVPVPVSVLNLVAFPLQLLVTHFAFFIIQALSIPAYQEGNMLYFAQTQLEVAEACSGIRSIVSLGMLSVIFVYLTGKGLWRKLLIIASVIPIAFLANTIRVSGTGILAHHFGEEASRGFLHNFSGVAVFAFGFMLLFAEYTFFNKTGHRQ